LDDIWNPNRQSPIPFSAILKSSTGTGSATDLAKRNSMSGNIQIYSSPPNAIDQELISDEDATIYKVKAAELEAKLKQMETVNSKLNEQLGITQTEYNDLENRHENLKHSQIIKVRQNLIYF
jgi:predicted nuclease with TOPRIM domain